MAARETGMSRQTARRQALRAVGRITFTLGAIGCIEPPPLGDEGEYVDGEPLDDAGLGDVGFDDAAFEDTSFEDTAFDGGAAADAGWGRDAQIDWVAEDAWVDDVDLGVDGAVGPDSMADASADATPPDAEPPCPSSDTDYDAWLKCCEERGWGSDPTCFAWGPPTPPAMRGAAQVGREEGV